MSSALKLASAVLEPLLGINSTPNFGSEEFDPELAGSVNSFNYCVKSTIFNAAAKTSSWPGESSIYI
jgi:hypothetical protein